MFQLSLSTILTSPTTPGAGLIPALSGDFSAALAGATEASVALPPTDCVPVAPRQGDAETGKSLPIPATDGAASDPALTWLETDGVALVAVGDAWRNLATKQDAPSPEALALRPADITPTPIANPAAEDSAAAIAIPLPAASAEGVAAVLAPSVHPDDSTQPAASSPASPQPAAADLTIVAAETPLGNIAAAFPAVAAIEPDPAPAKRADSKAAAVADAGDRRHKAKRVEDAPQPSALIGVIAGLPGTLSSAAAKPTDVPAPAITTIQAPAAPAGDHPQAPTTSGASAADGASVRLDTDVPRSAQPAVALATVAAPIRTPQAAATGPVIAPSAPGSPTIGAAPVAPSTGAETAPPHLAMPAPTPAVPADRGTAPADAQPPADRFKTDVATKTDAPAPPVTGPTAPPARPAPVPPSPQPAAMVLGVAFGAILPGQRPLGGDRPSPREQALQALTALAGAAPAAPIAAASGAQHNTLDMRRDDWPQAMIDRIEALRDAADATSTRITLVPDALGKVDLSIRHDGNTVHVHFAADAAQTRAILVDAQPKLAELAQQRGFRLGQATVDAGASGGGQRQQPQTGAPTPQRPASAFTATTAADAAADPTRLA